MSLSPAAKSLRSFCLPTLMAASTLITSGCGNSDQVDSRVQAQELVKQAEREESFKQFHAERQEYFLTRLEEIDLEKGKSFLYQELIKLCNDASRYNCEQMLSRFRGNVLPEFFLKLEEFTQVNLPEFKPQYNLPRTESETGILSPWNETVLINQFMILLVKHCERALKV